MKHLFQKLVVLGVVLVMFSACATTDSGKTKAEGTAFGAAIGAGVGAIAGAIFGGKQGAAWGAAAGAAVGAGAGYVAGSAVADKKQEYVQQEDQLNEQIRVVAENNKELGDYNEQMTTKITALQEEISVLKSRYSKGEAQATALKDKQDEITALISEANTRIDSKNIELAKLDEYQKTLVNLQNQTNVAKLDQEIGTLKNNIAMLDKNANVQMAQLKELLNVRR